MPWHTSVAFSASWLVKSIPCNRPNEPEVIVIGVLRQHPCVSLTGSC